MSADDVIQRAAQVMRTITEPVGFTPWEEIAQALYDAGLLVGRHYVAADTWRLRGEFIDAQARDWASDAGGEAIIDTAEALVAHLESESTQ